MKKNDKRKVQNDIVFRDEPKARKIFVLGS